MNTRSTGSATLGPAPQTAGPDRLPIAGLLALTMVSFVATANETVPAGLLPQIAQSFGVSQAWAGQLVTLCALGSGMAAIPLTMATRGWPRRLLLLLAIGVFLVCNAVTAVSSSYALTLAARFMVGVATGLAWSLLASHARRMVPPALQGRALAVAMVGVPLALSLGVPMSSWLGTLLGWRSIFFIMAGLSLVLAFWVRLQVPDYPGQKVERNLPMRAILSTHGVRPVLFVVMAWIMAHYTLYTYIAPFVAAIGLAQRLELVLLIFGLAAMLGTWVTGLMVDRWLRALVLICLGAFAWVALTLGMVEAGHGSRTWFYLGVIVWGLSFGGAPTLLQTALADATGDAADVAQSMLVTVFNLAFAGSGVIGGVLLETAGVASLPWVLLVIVLAGWFTAWRSAAHGFISGSRRST